MLTQKQPNGCGMFAVANALDLTNYVTPERTEASKVGNTITQLSKWLMQDGHNIGVDYLYYNHEGGKLPEATTEYFPTSKDGKSVIYLPILLCVRLSETGLNHMIGGRIAEDKTVTIFDSLKDKPFTTTLKELNEMYHEVYGLCIFLDADNGGHIFLHEASTII